MGNVRRRETRRRRSPEFSICSREGGVVCSFCFLSTSEVRRELKTHCRVVGTKDPGRMERNQVSER
jgi:hypothetical protein